MFSDPPEGGKLNSKEKLNEDREEQWSYFWGCQAISRHWLRHFLNSQTLRKKIKLHYVYLDFLHPIFFFLFCLITYSLVPSSQSKTTEFALTVQIHYGINVISHKKTFCQHQETRAPHVYSIFLFYITFFFLQVH